VFFDDDLQWHRQHFGRLGQIAAVDLWVDGTSVHTMTHQSDLVQRISRRRDLKTHIEKRFKGWHHMLLNAIANFALARGLSRIYSPTSDFAMLHTDRKRTVQRALFERIYDQDVQRRFQVRRERNWWRVEVEENRDRIIVATRGAEPIPSPKTICICHDVEAGLGHRDVDPEFARGADLTSRQNVETMLTIEANADVRATYNVVGL